MTRALVLLAALLCLGASAQAEESRSSLLRHYGFARAADLGMTEWALASHPRAVEGNPLMARRGLRYGLNVLGVALLVEGTHRMSKTHPKRAKWLRRTVQVVSYGLAVNAGVAAWKGRTR